LSEFAFPKSVYPVGRLDYDSEGLLLLSDDPKLNEALLDPRQGHGRTYLAQVENIPGSDALSRLAGGLDIEGLRTRKASVRLLDCQPLLPARAVPIRFRKHIPTAWIEITLTEGRNRQVRKMTAAVGYPTLRLIRVAIGALNLFDLGLHPGEWRELEAINLTAAFARSSNFTYQGGENA
jgi:23S rRNA pseudouridine2457 synthase